MRLKKEKNQHQSCCPPATYRFASGRSPGS